jgi:hypothetical protein
LEVDVVLEFSHGIHDIFAWVKVLVLSLVLGGLEHYESWRKLIVGVYGGVSVLGFEIKWVAIIKQALLS